MKPEHKRNLTATALGAAIGGLDGLAASADTDAGRGWDTTGIGATGTPVLSWGWAPGVQVGSALFGTALAMSGHDAGTGPMCMGFGLMARAAALKLAQRRQTIPATVQGYAAPHTTVQRTVAGMPAEIVRGRAGGRQHITAAG